MSKENRLLYSEDIKEVILMEKDILTMTSVVKEVNIQIKQVNSDGRRSCPLLQKRQKISSADEFAKTFIDRELDDLKFNQDTTINKKVNAELDQAIVFERNDHEIIITDIVAQPTRDSQEYRRAQIRMDRQNH